MLSISKTEARIAELLLRRFSESFTIRRLSTELKTSPAGAHKAAKKLESDGIISTERIGASLVCRLNLHNPKAEHLAAMLLSEASGKPDSSLGAKAMIQLGDRLLAVTEGHFEAPKGLTAETVGEVDLTLKVLRKDAEIIRFIEKGKVLMGESIIVKAIKNRGAP